jgi:hypothetical protein
MTRDGDTVNPKLPESSRVTLTIVVRFCVVLILGLSPGILLLIGEGGGDTFVDDSDENEEDDESES